MLGGKILFISRYVYKYVYTNFERDRALKKCLKKAFFVGELGLRYKWTKKRRGGGKGQGGKCWGMKGKKTHKWNVG